MMVDISALAPRGMAAMAAMRVLTSARPTRPNLRGIVHLLRAATTLDLVVAGGDAWLAAELETQRCFEQMADMLESVPEDASPDAIGAAFAAASSVFSSLLHAHLDEVAGQMASASSLTEPQLRSLIGEPPPRD